jgi:hypothetical protein
MGWLDNLGSFGNNYSGLLDDDAQHMAMMQGLFGLGAALSEAGAPSTQPRPRGIGAAGQGFFNAYNQAAQNSLQQKLFGLQMKEAERAAAGRQAFADYFQGAQPQPYPEGAQVPPGYQEPPPTDPLTDPAFMGLVGEYGTPDQMIDMLKVRATAPPTTSRPMTVPEMNAYGLPAGTSAEIDSSGDVTVLAKPGDRKRFTRKLSVAGDKIQDQSSWDGVTWTDEGAAYDRREPYVFQQTVGPNGEVLTLAIPRAQIAAAHQAQYGGEGVAPSPDAPALPAGAPPGAVVVGKKPWKPTADEAKAGGFADRMIAAEEILAGLEQEGTDLWSRQAEGAIWGLGNFAVSPEYQQFAQARRDFATAVLRRESGAAIADSEFYNADQQYFPVPGDGPDVIAQKRRNRETVIASMIRGAGKGYARPQRFTSQFDGFTPEQLDQVDVSTLSGALLDEFIRAREAQ